MIKLVLLFTLVVASLAAPQQYYNPYNNPATVRPIAILRLLNELYPDGSYTYGFDTENGISADQQGQQKTIGSNSGNAAQGGYSYTSPEGLPVQISYIADENGYQPQGAVLPTSPPIPEAILRSIAYIERARSTQPYNANPYRRY